MTKTLSIEVWSDIACPWCYVGKRRLEQALARFEPRDRVELTWRAFELDPSAPRERDDGLSYAERLAKKYGTVPAQAATRIEQLVSTARADGLVLDFTRIRPGNTFDAHRLLALAHARSVQDALKERFLRAYLSEGLAIGDPDVLSRLALEVGLDADEVSGLLAGDLYADAVRSEQREAHALGVDGVPFFLIGRRYALVGAQPAEVLLSALRRAWDELPERLTPATDEGALCGPDGCD